MQTTQYGGAIFTRECPNCERLVNPAKHISINQFMIEEVKDVKHTAQGTCAKCGNVELPFIGFEKGKG